MPSYTKSASNVTDDKTQSLQTFTLPELEQYTMEKRYSELIAEHMAAQHEAVQDPKKKSSLKTPLKGAEQHRTHKAGG